MISRWFKEGIYAGLVKPEINNGVDDGIKEVEEKIFIGKINILYLLLVGVGAVLVSIFLISDAAMKKLIVSTVFFVFTVNILYAVWSYRRLIIDVVFKYRLNPRKAITSLIYAEANKKVKEEVSSSWINKKFHNPTTSAGQSAMYATDLVLNYLEKNIIQLVGVFAVLWVLYTFYIRDLFMETYMGMSYFEILSYVFVHPDRVEVFAYLFLALLLVLMGELGKWIYLHREKIKIRGIKAWEDVVEIATKMLLYALFYIGMFIYISISHLQIPIKY